MRTLLEDGVTDVDYPSLLGIDIDTPCTVVAFHLVTVDNDDVELSVNRSRIIDAITVACEAFRRRIVAPGSDRRSTPCSRPPRRDSPARLTLIAEDICSRFGESMHVHLVREYQFDREGLGGVTRIWPAKPTG